jgi:hypothetical protein
VSISFFQTNNRLTKSIYSLYIDSIISFIFDKHKSLGICFNINISTVNVCKLSSNEYGPISGYQSTSTTSASASKSDDLYEDNTTKFASATSIGNSANIPHPMSSGPSTKKTPIPTTQIQDHSQAEQKKETENIPLPKLTVTGGFGHSRLSRNQKRTSTEHDTHQAPTELADANVIKTKNRSASVHSNAPSIASDFADKEEVPVPVPDTDNNENRPVDPPVPQQV